MFTCSVPSRATRAGHAFSRDRLADRGRPALGDVGEVGAARRSRASCARERCQTSRFQGVTSTTWLGSRRKRRAMRRRDHRLAEGRRPRAARTAAAPGVELGEDVVEEQQRRRGQELRLGQEQGEQGEPLLALRAEARAGRARRRDRERRRGAGRARSCRARRRASSRAVERGDASAGRRRRRAPPPARPSSASWSPKPGSSAATARRRASTSRAPSAATRSVHGATASRGSSPSWTRRSAAFRWASAARVLLRDAALAPAQSRREHAVEVGAADRRAALDDGEAVGCEDERRERSPEQLGRGEARAVELGRLAARREQLHPHLVVDAARGDAKRDRRGASRRSGSAARRVRVRGEKPCVATCSASSRFVFPAPFSPVDEHDPGREREIERRVRAEVPERDVADDQAAAGSAREPDRHDQVGVVLGLALQNRRAERADQLDPDRRRVDRLEAVAEELRVEADLERDPRRTAPAATPAPRRRPASGPRPSARPRRSGGGAASSAVRAGRRARTTSSSSSRGSSSSCSNCSGRSWR